MFKTLIFLQNIFASRRLAACKNVKISSLSKVESRKIHIKNNCRLEIGDGSIIEAAIFFDRDGASVKIGNRVFIGGSSLVCAESIEIGDDILISWGCTIVDHDSHAIDWQHRSQDVQKWCHGHKDWQFVKSSPIKIGNRAWLGFNVTLLKGVKIGEGAVVGACSVVTKDVPPYTVVAGNPARVIREIPPGEQ
jgi:galactoside O-acetyltransferase